MKRSISALLCLLASACTCAPEPVSPTIQGSVSSAIGQTLHPSAVYVRYEESTNTLIVSDRLGGTELARGQAVPDAVLPLALEGRPCALVSRGTAAVTDFIEPTTDPDTTAPRTTSPARERVTKEARVTLRCDDGPAPGITAPPSAPGLATAGWVSLALVVGLVLGFIHSRGEALDNAVWEVAALVLGLVAIVTLVVLSRRWLDGELVVTVILLGLVLQACGFLSALLAARNKEGWTRAGAAGLALSGLIGPLIIALVFPLWASGAPLAALAITLVLAMISAIISVGG